MSNSILTDEQLEQVSGGFNFKRAGEYLMVLHKEEFVQQVPAELVAEFEGYYNSRRNSAMWAFIYEHAATYPIVLEALKYAS